MKFSDSLHGICYLLADSHHQHKSEAGMSHLISVPPGFLTFLKEFSKAKLKGREDKASPCFRPFWIGKLPKNVLSFS
jgi:hypothetical protein